MKALQLSEASSRSTHQVKGIGFWYPLAMQKIDDLRKMAFIVIPGHGVMVAEKWMPGKRPFEVIWEAMDASRLCIDT